MQTKLVLIALLLVWNTAYAAERMVHPSRAPAPIQLLQDQHTVLMSYRGHLDGDITHSPIVNPMLRDGDNRIVYGFTSSDDRIVWTVIAEESAEYKVAVHYSGKLYNSSKAQVLQKSPDYQKAWAPQSVVEIESNGKVLSARLLPVTRYNEPNKVAGARQWLDGLLPLEKGENQITLRFSELSDQQIQAARHELDNGTLKKSTLSLGIKSLEIVRPDTLARMKQTAEGLKSDTQWMVDGKYGLFIHWSLRSYPLYGDQQAHETFEWGVNQFDVEAFAEMVEETGASWVTFTTCHGMQMFPAPIKTLENLLPGRTTKRDLISALAAALDQRNIKLLLYYNFSLGDTEFAEALGMDGDNPEKWFQYLINFSREVSERYGEKIAGWGYIDSSVPGYELNLPWESYFKALKAGNPEAVVAISSHWWAEFSPFNDLQTTDSGGALIEPLNPALYAEGARYDGLQQHFSFVIDGSWIPREPFNGTIRSHSTRKAGPNRPNEDYIEYFRNMDEADVPITANILITQDVTRNQPFVNPETLELMRQIRKALWDK